MSLKRKNQEAIALKGITSARWCEMGEHHVKSQRGKQRIGRQSNAGYDGYVQSDGVKKKRNDDEESGGGQMSKIACHSQIGQ